MGDLTGSLILFGAAIPYVVEVLRQVPLQTRVLAALPPATRAVLPPHPKATRKCGDCLPIPARMTAGLLDGALVSKKNRQMCKRAPL